MTLTYTKLSEQDFRRYCRSRPVLSVGMVARICSVAPRTVAKWADSGRLKHFRIPGSDDRRFVRENVARFLKDNGMPGEWLAGPTACLVVTGDAPLVETLAPALGRSWAVMGTRSAAAAGAMLAARSPEFLVLDLSLSVAADVLAAATATALPPELLAIESPDGRPTPPGFAAVLPAGVSAEALADALAARAGG